MCHTVENVYIKHQFVISNERSVHSQTIEDLTLINNELKLYEKSEEKCIEECVKATETLQEINIATQMKIHELSQLYTKAQKYPLFTHQMSLDQYLQKCDQFTKCADIYIQKIIKVQVSRYRQLRRPIVCSQSILFTIRFNTGW